MQWTWAAEFERALDRSFCARNGLFIYLKEGERLDTAKLPPAEGRGELRSFYWMKALCTASTALSALSLSMRTEILISLVEIISMFTPAL